MLNFQKMSSSKNVRENPHQLRNKNLFPELNFHNNSKLFYFSHNHEMWREMIANCSITGSDKNKRNENETLLLFCEQHHNFQVLMQIVNLGTFCSQNPFSSLIKGDDDESFNTANTLQQTQCSITEEEAVKEVQSQAPYDPQPDALPDSVDKWNFVNSGTLDLKDVSKMMSTILSAFVLIIIYGF